MNICSLVLGTVGALGLSVSSAAAVTLIHQFTFDSPAVVDSVGGATGSLVGDATISGGLLHLDGDGDYVQLTSNIIPTDNSDFSVVISAQQDSRESGKFMELISQGSSSISAPYGFYIGHDQGGCVRLGDNYLNIDPCVEYPDDQLMHEFVLTSSQVSGTKFFIDGVLAFSDTDYVGPINSGDFTRFGAQFWVYDEYLHGKINDIKVYDGLLPIAAVPIPASLPFLIAGLGGLAVVRRRRKAG